MSLDNSNTAETQLEKNKKLVQEYSLEANKYKDKEKEASPEERDLYKKKRDELLDKIATMVKDDPGLYEDVSWFIKNDLRPYNVFFEKIDKSLSFSDEEKGKVERKTLHNRESINRTNLCKDLEKYKLHRDISLAVNREYEAQKRLERIGSKAEKTMDSLVQKWHEMNKEGILSYNNNYILSTRMIELIDIKPDLYYKVPKEIIDNPAKEISSPFFKQARDYIKKNPELIQDISINDKDFRRKPICDMIRDFKRDKLFLDDPAECRRFYDKKEKEKEKPKNNNKKQYKKKHYNNYKPKKNYKKSYDDFER